MAENSHQKVIQGFFSRIEKELDVRAISGDLFSERVFDYEQKQKMDGKDTTKAANTVLASYLYENADGSKLERFLNVLDSDEKYPKHRTLAKDMRDDLARSLVGSMQQHRISKLR